MIETVRSSRRTRKTLLFLDETQRRCHWLRKYENYKWTAGLEMNMKTIFVVMNTTKSSTKNKAWKKWGLYVIRTITSIAVARKVMMSWLVKMNIKLSRTLHSSFTMKLLLVTAKQKQNTFFWIFITNWPMHL